MISKNIHSIIPDFNYFQAVKRNNTHEESIIEKSYNHVRRTMLINVKSSTKEKEEERTHETKDS